MGKLAWYWAKLVVSAALWASPYSVAPYVFESLQRGFLSFSWVL